MSGYLNKQIYLVLAFNWLNCLKHPLHMDSLLTFFFSPQNNNYHYINHSKVQDELYHEPKTYVDHKV